MRIEPNKQIQQTSSPFNANAVSDMQKKPEDIQLFGSKNQDKKAPTDSNPQVNMNFSDLEKKLQAAQAG